MSATKNRSTPSVLTSPHAGISLASGQAVCVNQAVTAAGTSSSRGPEELRCPARVRPRDFLASGHCPSDHHARFAAGTTLCAGHPPGDRQVSAACANTLPGDHCSNDHHPNPTAGNTLDAGQRRPDARRIVARVSVFALTGKRRASRPAITNGRPRGEIFRHYAGQQAPDDRRCPPDRRACSGFTTKSNREETTWM